MRRLRLPRALLALAVGATVTVLAAFAMAAAHHARSRPCCPTPPTTLGYGKNIVNVTLVDIRAWDTLGEISVLLVAATGVASLVFRHRRFGAAPRVPAGRAGQPDIGPIVARAPQPRSRRHHLAAGQRVRDPRYRSIILEVATRLHLPGDHGALGCTSSSPVTTPPAADSPAG